MKRLYTGSCHCKAVRWEVDLDLPAGAFACACPLCAKKRAWSAAAGPKDFRLLKGDRDGAEVPWGPLRHVFCRKCGVHSYAWGPDGSGGKVFAVSLACLDDAEPWELAAAPLSLTKTCLPGDGEAKGIMSLPCAESSPSPDAPTRPS